MKRFFKSFKKPAVDADCAPSLVAVLVDMQESFFAKLEEKTQTQIVEGQVELIRECARQDIPLILLEYAGGWGPTLGVLQGEVAKVPRQHTVRKHENNAFSEPLVSILLKKFQATGIILMGINASYCVLETAVSARKRRLAVFTGENLVADCNCLKCRSLQKSRRWYRKNGIFCDEQASLEFFTTSVRAT